ncbi:phage head closure protein [Achromobacter denitrificans]|uniref:phage head closure protein n=1 Tax=Achromobacter denitrificans TaxID=32002 RepID=UPI0023E8CA7D|nr:phage head closure protein [Achromobacter denitrificans]MDF3851356.1 phage head closure protein [Achromobacter denitrificans]
MRAGELNRRVILLRREEIRDAANELIGSWQPVPPGRWASIRHVSGLGTIRAGGELSVVKASIRMRINRVVAAGMRVRHGGDVYAVDAVLPDKSGRVYVDLVCRLLMPRELSE